MFLPIRIFGNTEKYPLKLEKRGEKRVWDIHEGSSLSKALENLVSNYSRFSIYSHF